MTTVSQADARQSYQREYYHAKRVEARNVAGEYPIGDEDRRERCRQSLLDFLNEYCGEPFYLPFSDAHKRLISDVQRVVLGGGRVICAMPRGSGKSTILSRAILWSALYAHRKFGVLVAANDSNFKSMLEALQSLLMMNDTLLADFPEAIVPLRELKDTPMRAKTQHWDDVNTGVKWSREMVRFPRTPLTEERGNSGVVISGGGLLGSLRGMSTTLGDGSVVRPDLLLFDDCQTRSSATSLSQTDSRERAVADALCMAGAAKDMSGLMSCTCIAEDDLSCRLLDNQRSPDWTSHRVKTLVSMPADLKFWEDDYDSVRRAELLGEAPEGSTNAFYVRHKERLDKGCVHYWPELIDPKCESAIQSAMNRYLSDATSFASELQNQPANDHQIGGLEPLQSSELTVRVNPVKRGVVPRECTTVTAGIDVQQDVLFYVVTAWTNGFGGCVCDYGTWPKRTQRYFTLTQVKRGKVLGRLYPKLDQQGRIRQGVCDLIKTINVEWPTESKSMLPVAKIMVDAGYEPDAVQRGVRDSRSPNANIYKGVGIGATRAPMSSWLRKTGETRGNHWVNRPQQRGRFMTMFDTNFWKSRIYEALTIPKAHSQALTFYDGTRAHHQMFCDHICNERSVRVQAEGRIVNEWRLVRADRDNHFFDCLVSSMVAASMIGVRRPDESRPVVRKRRKMRVTKLNV